VARRVRRRLEPVSDQRTPWTAQPASARRGNPKAIKVRKSKSVRGKKA
jgi:hypothetical protein